jgi:hypothetical protein
MYERVLSYRQSPLIGISQSLDPDRFQPRVVHCLCDGLSAAVNNDRLHANGSHKGDIGQQLFAQTGIVEDTSAEFDDHDSAAEAADILHRLDERTGFCDSFFHLVIPEKIEKTKK